MIKIIGLEAVVIIWLNTEQAAFGGRRGRGGLCCSHGSRKVEVDSCTFVCAVGDKKVDAQLKIDHIFWLQLEISAHWADSLKKVYNIIIKANVPYWELWHNDLENSG